MELYHTCLPDYEALIAADDRFADGIVTVPSDSEHAASFVKAFELQLASTLPLAFYPSAHGENPFSDSENIRDIPNKREKAQAILGQLPFVENENIDWQRQTWNGRRLVIEGDLLVPAERIISVRSFADWKTGLNTDQNAIREYTPDALGLGPGSLNAMITFASLAREAQPKDDGSLLVIARDTAGEYWGVLDCDGSHRAGAQKLRGDESIQVAKTIIHSDETMPAIAYGVRERFN